MITNSCKDVSLPSGSTPPCLSAGVNSWPAYIIVIITCLFLLLGAARQALAQEKEWLYIVSPGDNLWDISQLYLKDMGKLPELQRLNQIKRPRRLPPGMQLRVPISWLKVQPAVVSVQHVQGAVYVDRANGGQQKLTAETTVHVGDTVRAEAESMTTLRLADGSTILLQEQSQLTFDTLSIFGKTGMVDTRMRLLDGRVESDVKPIEAPSGRFEIWTPAALSSVRGTRFRTIMHKAEQRSRTEVSHGEIQVSADEQTILVAEGFGTVVKVGEPPAPPRPLLTAPDLGGLATIVTHGLPRFSITPLDGAVAYRMQIAHAGESNAPFFDHLFPDTDLEGPALGDGDYLLRVRGVDITGLEGLDADHPFSVDIRPEPPTSATPESGSERYQQEIQFQWQAPPNVASYHFQLATDQNFSNPLIDVKALEATTLLPPQTLLPGQYHWRIASVDVTGKAGDFGPSQLLTVLQTVALTAPQIQTAIVNRHHDQIDATWNPVASTSTYELQVAYDPEFKDLWQTINVADTTVKFHPPSVASYHLRVRAVDAAGNTGPYGQPYHVPAEPSPLWLFTAALLLITGLLAL